MKRFIYFLANSTLAGFVSTFCLASPAQDQQPVSKSGSAQADREVARSSGPTDRELIDAVSRVAEKEVKTQTKYRQVQIKRRCSQLDVANDPYMPKNPELAHCPSEGRTYSINETEPYQVQVKCPRLPEARAAWNVVRVDDDSWRLSAAGRSWQLTKLAGKRNTKGVAPGGAAHFNFAVKTEQGC